jgi:phosphomannomutase/phosphoglucomutase
VSFKIIAEARPNSFAFEINALIKPSGFREYDARWWFGHPGSDRGPDLNLIGVQALGIGLGMLIRRLGPTSSPAMISAATRRQSSWR